MTASQSSDFDFDKWVEMAKQDPSSFESMRLAAIDDVINSASEEQQQRLRSLQWRIDQERRQAKTPLGACINLSTMMWERVMGEGGLVDHLQSLQQGMLPSTPTEAVGAKAAAHQDNVVSLLKR